MAEVTQVKPADFMGLRRITWNRDPTTPIPAAEAFALYERNWRHVDEGALNDDERRLVDDLTRRFGHGVALR